jgi:ElaB/YqjD/DUF883 family membrane-anchored ribosome-binding protein
MSSKIAAAYEAAKEEGEVTMEHLEAMREDIEKELQQTRKTIMKEMKKGREYVEDRHVRAIGLAFGLGLAIGALAAIATAKGKDKASMRYVCCSPDD